MPAPVATRQDCAGLQADGTLTLEESLRARGALPHPTLEQLQAALPADTLLVRYFLYSTSQESPDVAVGAMAIRRTGVLWVPLGPVAALGPSLTDLFAQWSAYTNPGTGRSVQATGLAAPASAQLLRDRLWTPVVGDHRGPVWMVGDDALQVIPFHALPGRNPGRRLVQEQEILYLPNLLAALRPAVDYTDGALALADPAVRAELATRRTEGGPAVAGIPGRPLPRIRAASQDAWPDSPVGEAATETLLRQASLGARYLSLGVHGQVVAGEDLKIPDLKDPGYNGSAWTLLPNEVPELASVIYLAGASISVQRGSRTDSPPEATDPRNDGIFTAAELGSLDLRQTEVLMLWSCTTGFGSLQGRDYLGFRGAGIAAGAGTVIAPVWEVDDAVTGELLRRYSAALKGRKGKETAGELWLEVVRVWLEEAPVLSKQFGVDVSHPYYWASFLATGR
ncbi:MAG TPA: CHAT domain-containing protein [Myxococcota bacterium]|nr:CHAT domain-containing protein [Myxococcota bacterium]